VSRLFDQGRAGSAPGRSTAHKVQCQSQFDAPLISVVGPSRYFDMYAKAIEGMSPTDAVKWAHGEMVKVYSA